MKRQFTDFIISYTEECTIWCRIYWWMCHSGLWSCNKRLSKPQAHKRRW